MSARTTRAGLTTLWLALAVSLLIAVAASGCSSPPVSSGGMISTPYMDQPAMALSDQEYKVAVNTIATKVNSSLGGFASGVRTHDADLITKGLAGLIAARNDAAKLAPPPERAQVHELLMQGLDGYAQFARDMARAYTASSRAEAEAIGAPAKRVLQDSSTRFQAALSSLGL